jgi:hypothetical protein
MLTVEHLEDRLVPVTWGNPWPDATHLTLSLAKDNTSIAGSPSTLFKTLDARAARSVWQRELLRAWQTWAVNANVNVGLVADGGQAFGTDGLPQGDPRFGDIRVGAHPLPPDVGANTDPFDPTAGTWSGDVRLNSSTSFSVAGGPGQVDLYTALLQEAGHSLGINNSADPASPMYEFYQGPRTGLTGGDVANLQSLYGARTLDKLDGNAGHTSFGTALGLNLLKSPDGSLGVTTDGDLSSPNEVSVYKVSAPLTLGGLSFRLQTSGLSLLTAKVTVYDSSQRVVGSAAATDPTNGDLVVTVPSALPLSTYYVKVQGNSPDVFGIGSYRLSVASLPLVNTLTSTVNGLVGTVNNVLQNVDLHTNDSMLTATLLPPLTQTSSRFSYAYKASIGDKTDVDFYRVRAGVGGVMSVMVWGTDPGGLLPRATVYDARGNLVSTQVLTNENGQYVLQATGAVAGSDYFVKVAAADPAGTHNVGNYFLAVQFGGQAVQLDTFTQGTLNQAKPQDVGTLTVTMSNQYHFLLSGSATDPSLAAAVRMTIYDQQGNEVATAVAHNGETVSLTTTLDEGTYTVRFVAATADGSPLPNFNYVWQGIRLSDPIGPQAEDPSQSPPPPSGSTSGSSSGTTSGSASTSGSTSGSASGSSSGSASGTTSGRSTGSTSGTTSSSSSGTTSPSGTTSGSSSGTSSGSSSGTSSGTGSASPSSGGTYYYSPRGSYTPPPNDPYGSPYSS